MGLWNWIVTKATGIDPAAEQARSDAADAKTQELDARALAAGTWTQSQYDQAMADIGIGNASTGAGDAMGSIDQAAADGLKEGLNNVLDSPGQVVKGVTGGAGQVLWGIVKAIPWWLWIGGGAALFIWMGGLEMLGGSLKGRLRNRRI